MAVKKNIIVCFFLTILLAFNQAKAANKNCASTMKTGDYDKALITCLEELKTLKPNINSKRRLALLLEIASIHHQLENSIEEDVYLKKVRSHPDYFNHIEIQYDWNRKTGQKHLAKSKFKEAKTHFYQALEIAKSENNPIWLSKSYNDTGLAEFKLGDYLTSLENYQISLPLKKQHGTDYQIATTLNNLGLVYLELEKNNKAVSFYEQALEHYLTYTQQENFDERVYYNIAHIYEDLNKAYQANNNSQQAGYYAKAILKSFNMKVSTQEQTRAFINLAKWHIKSNNINLANTFMNEAERRLEKVQIPEYQIQTYFLRSKLQHSEEKVSAAIQNALKSLKLSISLEKDKSTAEIYQWLSRIYQAEGSLEAFEALEKYQEYREIFLNKKYNSDIKTIQHTIEKQQIEQDLLAQKLTNAEQNNKLQKLTNTILGVVTLLVVLLSAWFFYFFKKKKEKQDLLNAIQNHKQQLLLMETEKEKHISPQEYSTDISQLKEDLKKQLVQTMIDATHIWEVSTQSNRIELAEQSKIWTVSIDNGTLRTRSMDKYLTLDKIPDNPRWRNVIKTCHFILSKDQLSQQQRAELKQKLDQIMLLIKSLSLAPINL